MESGNRRPVNKKRERAWQPLERARPPLSLSLSLRLGSLSSTKTRRQPGAVHISAGFYIRNTVAARTPLAACRQAGRAAGGRRAGGWRAGGGRAADGWRTDGGRMADGWRTDHAAGRLAAIPQGARTAAAAVHCRGALPGNAGPPPKIPKTAVSHTCTHRKPNRGYQTCLVLVL